MAKINSWCHEDIEILRFVAGREWTISRNLPDRAGRERLKRLFDHDMVERRPISEGSRYYWYTIGWRGKKLLEMCGE